MKIGGHKYILLDQRELILIYSNPGIAKLTGIQKEDLLRPYPFGRSDNGKVEILDYYMKNLSSNCSDLKVSILHQMPVDTRHS